jgi:hypothetical protein
MKVLLDECVTSYLKKDFAGHEVYTVADAGFKGLKNGRLLQAASGRYDVLVTVDQNLQYQQNVHPLDLAVIVLKAYRSTYPLLKIIMPRVLDTLKSIKRGQVVVLAAETPALKIHEQPTSMTKPITAFPTIAGKKTQLTIGGEGPPLM